VCARARARVCEDVEIVYDYHYYQMMLLVILSYKPETVVIHAPVEGSLAFPCARSVLLR
jgi:hypothetical protein